MCLFTHPVFISSLYKKVVTLFVFFAKHLKLEPSKMANGALLSD